MNQTLKRTLALLMIFCLMIGFVPMEGMRDLIPQASAESGKDAVRNAEIPKAFSLPDSPLGVEHSSGPWRYALRVSDGYAVITGYDGADTDLVVPQELDGIDVVGLAAKALAQAEHVTLHTNIFYLAEDCFGKDLREITAPNGSLGLYWASTHDVTYSTGKDYDLVPGVIDYTDAMPDRVVKRGESHVVFGKLESRPLQVGSLFFMRDARDMEFFFRVLELKEQGDSMIATVEIPEVADAIINYQTTVAVDLTADDFIPADGVTVVESPASEKTISTTRNNKETTMEIGPFGALKETGRNDSTKVSVDISGKVVSKNTVIYTVNIENGVFTATEYTQEQTLETSVTISAKAEENLLKEYGQAQETLKKLSEGKPASEEEKSKLKAIAGRSFEDASGNSAGVSAADIVKASSQIEKMTEAITSGKPTGGTWECGAYTLQTPYFNVSVSVSINVSVSGSIAYSNSHTNVTKNVYNFNTDEWETVYSNGNAAEGKDGQSIVAQIKGKVGLEVEVSVGAFFVKNFSFKLELGVEFSASKKFGNGNTLAFLNCTIFTIKPYMQIKVYLGIWVGKSTGFKHEIYNKEWSLQELTGREYLWQAHINIALSENKVHSADECPLDSAKTVSYDTKTGLQVQKKTVFVGKPLTGEFNVNLNQYAEVKAADWKAGAFLGWAWNETDTEPTAAKPGEAFQNPDGTTGDVLLTQNVTLYAVWSQTFTVHFDTNGGTEVPDQSVPSGGYITKPQNPTKELGIFVGWRDGNGKYWDFERDTVSSNITLTADWGDGDAPTPGMLNAAYIGEYDDVSDDCKYNPNSLISSGVVIPAHYLTYETKYIDGNPVGLVITGVKNNPARLIIPKTLPYGSDEKGLEVIDIKTDAFRDCTSIRSVYFLTDDDKRFTTSGLFQGCTNLEYAELPTLEDGRIGDSIFSGCSSLKCVKVRAGAIVVGNEAFSGAAIRTCILENGIKTIGERAFQNCTSLENLYIPDTVKTISVSSFNGPFTGCTGMKRISVGGVETLKDGMLKTGSQVLEKLTIRGTVTNIGSSAFDSENGYSTVSTDYANGYSYNGHAELEIEEGVKTIENYAFMNCNIFSTITIPESITSIGNYAFKNCVGVHEINLPYITGWIERYAFQDCINLKSVILREAIGIDEHAFDGCKSLIQLELGKIETIGTLAFQNCTSLENLYIPDTVKTISVSSFNGPFTGCTGMKRISVGGVETLKDGMLKTGSQVLEKLTIRGTVTNIGSSAFDSENGYSTVSTDYANGYSYNGHAELEIEEGVKTIENYAFMNCNIFSTITIPESITSIGNSTFANCSNLKDILFHGSNMPFAGSSLSGCTGLTIHIHDENDVLLHYCEEKGIPYDTAFAFPYTLTLHMNRTKANEKTEKTINWMDTLELPTPTWEGHVFSGWYSDADCTTAYTGTTMPNADLTLYAGWDIDVYTLTLNLLGGTAAKTEYRVHAGDKIGVNIPTKSGCYFLGWSTDEAGVNTFNGVMPAADTTLYALWQPESVNGRYRNDGDHMTLIGYDQIEEESTTVYLPETVDGLPLTAIAAGAFANSDVKTLYIPASVTNIEPGAFYQSRSLTNLNVAENNPSYSSKSGVIYSKDGTEILFFPPVGGYRVYLSENVQRIGERAFDGTLLESIDLPESVAEIGARAFRNTAITELTLPEGVETISERAFTGCRDLALVEALGSPENVDSTAFSGCNGFLLAYGPDEDCAFRRVMRNNGYLYNAYTLTMVQPTKTTTAFLQSGAELMLPDKPATLENEQFTGWYLDDAFTEAFTETTMPAHELTIYAGTVQVFDYETATNEGTDESSLTLTYCYALGDSVEIPESIDGVPVTKLASGTFSKQYRQVKIPASVTEIESGAFAEGTVLVCVPGSAAEAWAQENGFSTGVMTWTLRYDTDFELVPDPMELPGGSTLHLPEITRTGYTLSGWYWDGEHTESVEPSAVMPQKDTTLYAGWTVSDEAVAQMADALQWTLDPATDTVAITAYTGTATVLDISAELHGKTVTAVEDYAFAYNPTLTEVKLPNTVTVIGARAFFAMHALTEVILPASLKAIPDEAFTDCIELDHISLPASLETIGANAFKNTGLTGLCLPTSLKSIHTTALTDCAALTEITVTTGNRYYESRDGVLFDTADGVLVKYPAARPNSSYTVENTWSVGAWAFDGAQNLTEITLSSDVWSLGEGAFAGCGKLTAMPELGSMVTIIPDRCFYGCSSLSEAVIPDTVRRIGSLAFAGTALTDLTIPQSVTEIGADAFGTDVILHGDRESYACTWAKGNNRVFIPIGSVAIESITIEQESMTMKRGERTVLRVTVEPSNADPDFLTFYSSAAGIASVDEDGVIHAVGGGDAVIFATAPGGISASCRVSVEVDVETITLNAEAISLIVGDTEQLRESFTPLRVTDRSIVWTSSNEETVTVDQKGFVTAVGDGEAVIRATAHNGIFAECKVHVYNKLTSFTIDGDSVINAEVGGTVQLQPHFEPENVISAEVCYTSSDETVVTVNETGLLSFQAPGASIITAIPQADETKEVKILTLCGLDNKLTLPAALSVIEEEAFAETAAQYVYIPSSVTRIGSKAFSDSEALWVAEFESGNAQIAGDAFDGCENLIILAPASSKAAAWATAKGIPVMALGSAS